MKKFTFMCCLVIAAAFMQAQVTLHVPAEYNTIQAGINAANPGDIVLVSDGIYYEQINFLGKKPLTVASEFLTDGDENHITNTIIDGSQIPDGDSCSVVYFINGEDTTSVLCGFTIRNGNVGTAAAYPTGGYLQSGGAVYIFGSGAKIMYNHITQNSLNGVGFKTTGAGISAGQWWEDSHWVVIDHNTIDNNSCYSDSQQTFGTGICVTCNTRITNNVISDNVNHGTGSAIGAAAGIFAGGELYWQSLTAVVINNTLKNNVAISESNYGGGAGGAFQCNSVIFQGNIVEDNEVNTTSSSGGGVMFWAPRTGSVFSGNTFRHNIINGSGGGLYLEYVSTNVGSDTVLVENNYFNENSATIGGGFATKNNPAVLQNNVFTLNHATNSGGAINIRGNNLDHTAILMNNSFYQNSTEGQGGAIYSFHGRPLITNSIFYQDTASSIGNEIYLATTSDTVEIAFCDINPTLIEPYSSFLDGGGNINLPPQFDDSDLLTILASSPCLEAGTATFTCQCGQIHYTPGYDIDNLIRPWPENGEIDMGAHEFGSVPHGHILRVPAEFPTIQAAINAANTGDTVLVSDRTYNEQINFLGKKPLMVASEFLMDGDESHIANTIIDGSQILDGDSCSIVYFINGEDTTSVLCGFTIQHGKGTIYTTLQNQIKGGGGIFLAGSGAKVIHNHITENHLSNLLQEYPPIITGAAIHTKFEISDSLWVVVAHNTIDYNSCKSHLTEASGAGLSICANSRITNNIISWNSAIGTGSAYACGAAYICGTSPDWSTAVTTVVENNIITNNLAKADNSWANAAGGDFQAISGILENNYIAYNEVVSYSPYFGGFAFLAIGPKENTIVRGNTFYKNLSNANGGALGFQPISDTNVVMVENNYFLENEGIYGGAMGSFNSPVILQNNVFRENSASHYGGGIWMRGTQTKSIPHYAVLMNNSFFGNKADQRGGAIYTQWINPVVMNTIFWNDSTNVTIGPEIYLDGISDTLEIAYSNIDFDLIKGNVTDGGGNINEDPQFDDPDSLTLLESSPCIDAGTDAFTCECGETHISPGYDIDLLIRPYPENAGWDIGAHEFGSIPINAGINDPISISNQLSVVSYPNPFTGYTTLEYELEHSSSVSLSVYNHLGQQVSVLVDGEQTGGSHKVQWNAEGMPAGIYFYRLTINDYRLTTATGKIVKY